MAGIPSAQEVETGRLSFQGPAEHTVRIKEEKLKTYRRAGAGVLGSMSSMVPAPVLPRLERWDTHKVGLSRCSDTAQLFSCTRFSQFSGTAVSSSQAVFGNAGKAPHSAHTQGMLREQ